MTTEAHPTPARVEARQRAESLARSCDHGLVKIDVADLRAMLAAAPTPPVGPGGEAFESEEAFQQLMADFQIIYGMKVGHVITQDDIDGLYRLDKHWRENDESATDAHERGFQLGREEAGGTDLSKVMAQLDSVRSALAVTKALYRHSQAERARLQSDLDAARKEAAGYRDDSLRLLRDKQALLDERFAAREREAGLREALDLRPHLRMAVEAMEELAQLIHDEGPEEHRDSHELEAVRRAIVAGQEALSIPSPTTPGSEEP